MKEKFIAEIEAFTTDEQVMSATEKIKSFPVADWDDLMEHIRRAAIRIQITKLDQAKKEYGLGQ